MAGTIKINNPIVGGIIILLLLFILWFVVGPFGLDSPTPINFVFPIIMTGVAGYVYYKSFWGKK